MTGAAVARQMAERGERPTSGPTTASSVRRKPNAAQQIVIAPSTSWSRPWPAAPTPGETVEEFQARNGMIEQLPPPWERPR
ncbi:hypothetical protein [Luteimonas sp. MHLX1A]|uniref:hypothetical protein n=1 Tax=Alterluteimonas muca TaxID=2878684 RepID=UPI001E2C0C70|nr:hypothetical protein [Luteimonas sp. MHLX1A]MCD9046828.1 hypothetical protein [Luteimonas sp. MHLX1A]